MAGKRGNISRDDPSSSSESDESDAASPPDEAPEFVPEQCLFCNEASDSFDANLLHMQKSHGLFIKDLDHLIVDFETLVRYLHLVIFGYHECLYCHSQRRTLEAAQQHMRGKSHCKLDDIQNPESEYRDFFDFAAKDAVDEEGSAQVASLSAANVAALRAGGSVRLPSGRTISSRIPTAQVEAAQLERHQRQHSPKPAALPPSQPQPVSSAAPNAASDSVPVYESSSQALSKRGEKHGAALADQLVHLSVNDRMSLAHLPSSQQRSLLATQKKQADKAERAKQRARSRVELLGNSTLMEHFISETPARRLRYAWC